MCITVILIKFYHENQNYQQNQIKNETVFG